MNAVRLLTDVFTITDFELRKVWHDKSQVLIRAVQPVLWLLVFGEVFAKTRLLPTGNYNYLQFLTPGILAQSVIFVAIFYGFNMCINISPFSCRRAIEKVSGRYRYGCCF